MSVAAVMETEPLFVPDEVRDLASFRAWVHTADLPEHARIHFLNGHVYIDTEREPFESHNRVRTALGRDLVELVEGTGTGFYLGDGVRFTSEDGDFSTEADGVVILATTLTAGRVWFASGATTSSDATELVGSPDIVIEVVSRHSVRKDTDWHFENYHAAGVPEYWVIDARGADIAFDIWKRGAKGYTAPVSRPGG